MKEILTTIEKLSLFEVNEMCESWKASYSQKEAYDACNKEIFNRLKDKMFDVNTIVLILKTFVLGVDDLQHVEQSMNLSYLLRISKGVALSDKVVDIHGIHKLYTDFIKRVEDINKSLKVVLPDTEKASNILQNQKDIVSIYEETKKYNNVMSKMLDIHIEYDLSIVSIDHLPSFKIYPLLNVDKNISKHFIEDYITFFYDYFDMALDVLEAFINYYEKLMTTNNVKKEVKQCSIDPNDYDDPKKVSVLLNHTIFEMQDLLDEENQMGVEWHDRDDLADMALKIVEERFEEGLFDKDSLDLLEKALLLGFNEENVQKAYIYISMIINQIEGFDPEDDVLKLSLIEGELSQKTQELFTFDNLFDDEDEIDDFIVKALIEMEGKEVLETRIKKIASVFATLLDRYYDYIESAEENFEDYINQLLSKFNIETSDDPLDYVASVYEYYSDYDHKLFKFNYALD